MQLQQLDTAYCNKHGLVQLSEQHFPSLNGDFLQYSSET